MPHYLSFAAITILVLPQSVLAGGTWPQWRGPNRDCRVEAAAWPLDVSASLTSRFQVPLGESYSGPVISTDRIFVTETVGANEAVRALDRQTGDEVWKVEWSGAMKVPFFAAANGSWIRSTPALAGDRLLVASMEDVLVCLNTKDGAEIWRKDFRSEFGTKNQSFGFVCSPLVWNDSVFVQTSAGLIKLALTDGTTQWQALNESGGMMGGAFSSPAVSMLCGQEQLLVQTRKQLCGVSPVSGKLLWSVDVPAFRGMNILTPTVSGDRVFTSSYGGGAFLFEVTKTDDEFGVSKLWETKTEGYMSSPVVHDGHVYLHLRNQRFTCLHAESGKPTWKTKPFGKYWSMAVNGDQCLVLDERGDLLLLRLNNSEFEVLDRTKVSKSPTWAHVAVAGEQVFVRSLDHLLVFDWSTGSESR